MTATVTPTATGFHVRTADGAGTGLFTTRKQVEEFLTWCGLTEERKDVEAMFDGGNVGTC